MNILEIKNLCHTYQDKKILDNISLHLKKGERVAIVGPSGVGKSTIFNIIAGIEAIQTGEISINQSTNYLGKVAYMLQKDLLLEHKTIAENIALPLIIKKIKKKEAIKEAKEKLTAFQLIDYADKYPKELSGGMRQRVALLRTLVQQEDILLLDEAFSALDYFTKIEVQNWYLELAEKLNLSSLLISHDIDEAINLSNRIYILKHQPAKIVANIKINLDDNQDINYQKSKYKTQILDILKRP